MPADYARARRSSDVWRRDVGMGVGHVETRPKLVPCLSRCPMPHTPEWLCGFAKEVSLGSGKSLHTFALLWPSSREITSAHSPGYRRFMGKQGLQMAAAPSDGFGAIWCAWGYGRTVQPKTGI